MRVLGDSGFVRIREVFELGGVELERVHCKLGKIAFFFVQTAA